MTDSPPPWIKRAEHGALGEARAHSFLLERFWVLERSIDKDGADFLIQRRLTDTNFLSKSPPRLGVVQVKFIQNRNTAIRIPSVHVQDSDGVPFNEFFLLVYTGREDNQRQFLLGAKEISEAFDSKHSKEGSSHYRIPGGVLLDTARYEITSATRALGRIDHALRNADFRRNRRYLNLTHVITPEPHHINHDYLVPLDNSYGEIDRAFYEQKKKLQSTLFELEEVVEAMHKIIASTDPVTAFDIYEDVIWQHVGGGYHGNLMFDVGFLADEDLIHTAENHKKRLNKLRKLGLEQAYLDLLEHYGAQVVDWVLGNEVWSSSKMLSVVVRYDDTTLRSMMFSPELLSLA